MKKREDVLNTLRALKPYLTERFFVSRIGLFGSVAREEATETSDIDILVEVDPKIGWYIVDLADYLEQELGASVDLVSRSAISPRMWPYIEEDLLYA